MPKTAVRFFFIFGLAFVTPLGGCQTSKKSGQTQKSPKIESLAVALLQMTGQNHHPVFSNDGRFIMFLSHDRPSHKKSQIYTYDLNSNRERRITYQDGEIYDLVLDQNSKKIIYSSSTDEVKENLSAIAKIYASSTATPDPIDGDEAQHLVQVLGSTLPPTEIYISSVDGYDIHRLTHKPGFDGQLSQVVDNKIYYSEFEGSSKKMQLRILDLRTKKSVPFVDSGSNLQSQFDDEFPAISNDGKKIAWVRSAPKATQSEIWIANNLGKGARQLAISPGLHLHPIWHPKGKELIFSSNLSSSRHFNLFSIREDGRCLTQVTSGSGTLLNPRFNSDGTKLIATVENPNKQSIGLIDYKSPNCPDEAPPSAVEEKTPSTTK